MFLPLYDKNPLRVIPFQIVTCSIILACCLVFALQQWVGEERAQAMLLSYGLLPALLFDHRELTPDLAIIPAELTLFSALFLHAGWMHLIGNMAFLWVFGDNVEDSMGHWRFLLFYLLCGLSGSVLHALFQVDSVSPLIGASGAVSGVMAAYLVLHPRVKILLLVLLKVPIMLPAYLLIGIWLILQIYPLVSSDEGNVAWWAHIGGFVCGAILVPFFRRETVPLFDRGTPH